MQAPRTFVPSYGVFLQSHWVCLKTIYFSSPGIHLNPSFSSSFAEKAHRISKSCWAAGELHISLAPFHSWAQYVHLFFHLIFCQFTSANIQGAKESLSRDLHSERRVTLCPLSKKHVPRPSKSAFTNYIQKYLPGICPFSGMDPKGCNGNTQWQPWLTLLFLTGCPDTTCHALFRSQPPWLSISSHKEVEATASEVTSSSSL